MRIVLDTNIILSGLISPKGAPAVLLQAWTKDQFSLFTSVEQLDELKRAAQYDRLKNRIAPGQIKKFVHNVEMLAVIVEPKKAMNLSPDPDDDLIIGLAVAGQANFLVTGDKNDLLALGEVEGIPIISARKAVETILS